MISFIIPLRGKDTVKDWHHIETLLKRTVKSILKQTRKEGAIFIVHNEKPDIGINTDVIKYVPSCHHFPNHITDPSSMDKSLKIIEGIKAAKSYRNPYLMVVDADDCIHNGIVEYIMANKSPYGWYLDRGYRYAENKGKLYVKRKKFYMMCGTSFIFHFDVLKRFKEKELEEIFFDHQKIYDQLKAKGIKLKKIPFKGALYITHTQNMYFREECRPCTLIVKVKDFLNRRQLTSNIAKQYNYYSLT